MSRLTLEEAILHAEEVAEINRASCECNTIRIPHGWISNVECAEEHEQLAEWLKELQRYKDLEEAGMIYEIFYFKPYEQWNMVKRLPLIQDAKELGKTVFLTKAEAEAKLAELKGE